MQHARSGGSIRSGLGLVVWLLACGPRGAAPTTAPEDATASKTASAAGANAGDHAATEPTSERPHTAASQGEGEVDDAEWEHVATEAGIVVTKRVSQRSELPVFRGEAVVDASPLEVLAVLTDAERHREWVYSCSDSGLVERSSDTRGVIYNRTATPWPVPDRDVVLSSEVELLDGEREIYVRFFAVEHPARPPAHGVVRIPYLEGHYHLRAEGPQRTRVEYQVDSDPGGRLPTWLATRGTRDMPFETLQGLQTQVERTRGEYAEAIEAFRQTLRADPS